MDENDGRPRIGNRHLGVRDRDIPSDASRCVRPRTGGMSVAVDSPMNLVLELRPKEFGGTGSAPIWTTTTRTFVDPLAFRISHRSHGLVEPARVMTLEAFRGALAATQAEWTRAEPPPLEADEQ